MTLPIAVLASGSGSNFQAIAEKIKQGALDAEIRLLVCNRPGAGVIDRAQSLGIPFIVLDHTDTSLYPTRPDFDRAMVDAITESGAEWIVLAGYMRLLTTEFLSAFRGKVLNIHPALLPSFPGLRGNADAIEYGVKIAGVTVHFVEEEVDSGPVIIQAAVPVKNGETAASLADRIHALEHRIYPQALQWIAAGRLNRGGANGRTITITPDYKAAKRRGSSFENDCLICPRLEEGF